MLYEFLKLSDCLRSRSGHFNDEQSAIFLRSVAKLSFLDSGLVKDYLTDIISSATRFVDGFPDERGIWHIQLDRERLRLDSHGGPHVVVGGKNGDVRVHVSVLELACDTGTIVVQVFHVWPPSVILVVIGSVLDPTWECRLWRGIVEPMPNRVGNTGYRTHV